MVSSPISSGFSLPGFRIVLDMTGYSATVNPIGGEEPGMIPSDLFRKRKILFFAALLLAFSAFTADILDLREELLILSSPSGGPDDNVTTGVVTDSILAPEPVLHFLSAQKNSSVEISFIHLLPFGFRAPPSRS